MSEMKRSRYGGDDREKERYTPAFRFDGKNEGGAACYRKVCPKCAGGDLLMLGCRAITQSGMKVRIDENEVSQTMTGEARPENGPFLIYFAWECRCGERFRTIITQHIGKVTFYDSN
jgi:hypothetical protein